MQIDELDRKILRHMQEDGRISFVTLANLLQVSEGTIRKRVRKLEDMDVLQIIGVTDPLKAGLDNVAFIWFKVERNKLNDVIAELESIKEIRYLVFTTGTHDIVAMTVLPTREELINLLNKRLGQIPGVQSTETSIVLEIHKHSHKWNPFETEYMDGDADATSN